jgi:acylphosphatase
MGPETGGATTRCRVIYHGHVQGVCFRATAFELSRRNKVVGYVRNRRDGTVELEAEGASGEVDSFLAAVAQEFTGYIAHEERTSLPPRGHESHFDIRY